MNKTLKGIIGGGVLLAALGGVLVVLKLTEKKPEQDSSSSEPEAVMLWHAHSDDISSITVEPAEGKKFVAKRRIDKTETTDLNGSKVVEDIANYYLTDYEDLPMDTTGIRLLATRAPELAAVEVILENAEESDYARFGLDHPTRVTYEVDGADGPIVFLIGSKTQVDSNYYLRMDGKNTVYTVESAAMEPFLKPEESYLGLKVTEEQAEDDTTQVESVRIARKDLDYDIYLEYDPFYEEFDRSGGMAKHAMVEPIPCMLSPDKSADATHGLYGLTATEIVTPHPTEAQLASCGLDDPFATVTMKTDDGKTTVFKLGKTYEKEDGTKLYYGYLDTVKCIYGFSADATIYDNVVAEDITSKNIIAYYVWDVGHLVCEGGGKKLDFEGMGSSAEDYVLKLNGKSYENLERYRQFYSFLLQTKAEDLVIEKVALPDESKKRASISVKFQKIDRGTKVDFYESDGLKVLIAIDGEVRFRCRKSYVDVLLRNIEIFEDESQAFTTTW